MKTRNFDFSWKLLNDVIVTINKVSLPCDFSNKTVELYIFFADKRTFSNIADRCAIFLVRFELQTFELLMLFLL